MQPRRWSHERLEALRFAASRGATFVEYALVFALVAVVSLGALEFLRDSASDEIDNQAVCVSDRPPPTDDDNTCRFAPVPTDVTYPDPNVVPPTTAPPVEFPDIYTVAAGAPDSQIEGGTWWLYLPVTVFVEIQEPPAPAEGAPGIPVRARVMLSGQPIEQFTECITDVMGECTLAYPVPFGDVDGATMLVIDVATNPPPESLPPMASFTKP